MSILDSKPPVYDGANFVALAEGQLELYMACISQVCYSSTFLYQYCVISSQGGITRASRGRTRVQPAREGAEYRALRSPI